VLGMQQAKVNPNIFHTNGLTILRPEVFSYYKEQLAVLTSGFS